MSDRRSTEPRDAFNLSGPHGEVTKFAWSPSGSALAGACWDNSIYIWDIPTGELIHRLVGHKQGVTDVRWSSSGDRILSGSDDTTAIVWQLNGHGNYVATSVRSCDGTPVTGVDWVNYSSRAVAVTSGGYGISWDPSDSTAARMAPVHGKHINSVRTDPTSDLVASASDDGTIRLWAAENPEVSDFLNLGSARVTCVAWYNDGRTIAAGDWGGAIQIWDTEAKQLVNRIQTRSLLVDSLNFSDDGLILASRHVDGSVTLYESDTWSVITNFSSAATEHYAEAAISPGCRLIVAPGNDASTPMVRDMGSLLTSPPETQVYVSHARTILLGAPRSGKTCLARALAKLPYQEQQPTQGIAVSRANAPEALDTSQEVHVWDMSGESEYHFVHSLFLDPSAVHILVIDGENVSGSAEIAKKWKSTLIAIRAFSQLAVVTKSDLLAGGLLSEAVSQLRSDLDLEVISTSAKSGSGVLALERAIVEEISWHTTPVMTTLAEFVDLRQIVSELRTAGSVLVPSDQVRRLLQARRGEQGGMNVDEYTAIIDVARAQGIVWPLKFGNLLLLTPEVLDAYVSCLVRTAQLDPSGLATIDERAALDGLLEWGDITRVTNSDDERLLLHAAVEICIQQEIAFRSDGRLAFLAVREQRPATDATRLDEAHHPIVEFVFRGNGTREFVRLLIRLAYCGIFDVSDAFASSARVNTVDQLTFLLELTDDVDGNSRICVSSIDASDTHTHHLVCSFVDRQLRQQIRDIQQQWRPVCGDCGTPVLNQQAIARRLSGGKNWIRCQACDDSRVVIRGSGFMAGDHRVVAESSSLDAVADSRQRLESSISLIQAKRALAEFDVFLSYASPDRGSVISIAEKLLERGVRPWLDIWEIPPGRGWSSLLQTELASISAAAIVVGDGGLGHWQDQEVNAVLATFADRAIPVIPVLLAGRETLDDLPVFLRNMQAVDMSNIESGIDALVWGITGIRPIGLRPPAPVGARRDAM